MCVMNKEEICLESAAKWQKKACVFVAVCSLPASIRRTPPCYHGNCDYFPTTLNMHSYISPYVRLLFKAPSFLQITSFHEIPVCVTLQHLCEERRQFHDTYCNPHVMMTTSTANRHIGSCRWVSTNRGIVYKMCEQKGCSAMETAEGVIQ